MFRLAVIPLSGALFVAVMLLGPGQQRPVVGARLFAAADEDGQVRSLRLMTVERGELAELPRAQQGLELKLGAGTGAVWSGETGPDGTAEITLSEAAENGTLVSLLQHGSPLTQGALASPPTPAPSLAVAELSGTKQGTVRVVLRAPLGAYVPSIPGELEIALTDQDKQPVFGHIELSMTGIEPATLSLDISKPVQRVPITVMSPPARIEARASVGTDQKGELQAELPLTMGAVGLGAESSPTRLSFVSPAPREAVFVSLYDRHGRAGGARIALHEDPDGFFRGHLWDSKIPDLAGLVVATDPWEAASVAWPAPGRSGRIETARVSVALDGIPAAVAGEQRRLRVIHMLTIGVVSLTSALEILLLLWTVKRPRRVSGEAHQPGSELPLQSTRSVLVVSVALVLLAAAAVAGLVVGR